MTRSESGKLGASKALEIRRINVEHAKLEYGKSPKLCLNCGIPIEFLKRLKYRFCNHSCAASYHNKKASKTCLHCGKRFVPSEQRLVFCGRACGFEHKKQATFEKFLSGKVSDSVTLKRCLVQQRGHKCEECNLTAWMGKPIPLDSHHADGNWKDNAPKNLRLLCKNCHALTPTYGIGNRGKGRTHRYRRLALQDGVEPVR